MHFSASFLLHLFVGGRDITKPHPMPSRKCIYVHIAMWNSGISARLPILFCPHPPNHHMFLHFCGLRNKILAGLGVYIPIAHSSHTSSSGGGGAQPSNTFATVHTIHGLLLRCCTNSSSENVGSFIFPNGVVRTSDYLPAYIRRLNSGCIVLDYYKQGQYFTLSHDAVGIYTCTRPDREGNLLQEHIGIYNEGFNSKYKKEQCLQVYAFFSYVDINITTKIVKYM